LLSEQLLVLKMDCFYVTFKQMNVNMTTQSIVTFRFSVTVFVPFIILLAQLSRHFACLSFLERRLMFSLRLVVGNFISDR